MRTKNVKAMTITEAAHVEHVKGLPCSVCDAEGPSDAHHIKLAALGGGIGALFIDKDKHQPFEVIVAAGVIGVRLHHQLLFLCQ